MDKFRLALEYCWLPIRYLCYVGLWLLIFIEGSLVFLGWGEKEYKNWFKRSILKEKIRG